MKQSSTANGANGKNLRQHRRFLVKGDSLQVAWVDNQGKMKNVRTKVINVSEGGIALQMPEPLTPALVRFQSKQLKIDGVGTVRHCRSTSAHYVVGLEFEGPSRWLAPEGEIHEPIPLCDPAYAEQAKAKKPELPLG